MSLTSNSLLASLGSTCPSISSPSVQYLDGIAPRAHRSQPRSSPERSPDESEESGSLTTCCSPGYGKRGADYPPVFVVVCLVVSKEISCHQLKGSPSCLLLPLQNAIKCTVFKKFPNLWTDKDALFYFCFAYPGKLVTDVLESQSSFVHCVFHL